MDDLKNIVESLLFVAEEPLSVEQVKQVLSLPDTKMVRQTLNELMAEYEGRQSAFTLQLRSSDTRRALIKSKKEGLRNKVNATPTLFINGRRYLGDLDRASLQDVLEEAADRAQGRRS